MYNAIELCYSEFMGKQKHVIPTEMDVVNQQNDLSQASYSMPVIQRRLVFLAMAQVRNDDPTRVFTMPVAAVLRALGMSDDRYRDIEAEVDKLFDKNKVKVKDSTKKGYKFFTWVNEVEYIEAGEDVSQHTLKIELNQNVLPYARTLQKSFHQFQISQIAKLQGRHALRIFELVSSNMGLAGKGGNPPGVWWFQATIQELRDYLAIAEGEYPRAGNLRSRVIDAPVEEINKAGLGLNIRVEYARQGKFLTGVKFICCATKPGDPKPTQPATESERDYREIIEKYPEKFEEFKAQYLKQLNLFDSNTELGAIGVAVERLQEWEKIQKKEKKIPSKRGAKTTPKE